MFEVRKQIEAISAGCVQITPLDDLERKLAAGRPLTVKLGCDPSRPDLHLGHSVVLRKLRQFQDFGHKVVLIVGDFTGMIGDPTGRSKTRPALSLEETRRNGVSYMQQAALILDSNPAKLSIVYNSEWLNKMTFREVVELSAKYTVARMLERDDFRARRAAEEPIGVHEFLYPLAQAYDSVAIKADIEIGGVDQTFNLMVGRDIQREYGLEPQVVLTMPLLVGLDGKEKMSKSLGNYIALTDPADDMYKKLMMVPDILLADYLTLLTDLPPAETLAMGAVEAHRALAAHVVTFYHGPSPLEHARQRYGVVAKGAIPETMAEVRLDEASAGSTVMARRLVVIAGLAASLGEADRLIRNRGIKLDGATIDDPKQEVPTVRPLVIQRGKDQFCRILPALYRS